MDEMEFIYHQGKFMNWHDAKIHVLTHSLHYGGGAFEGIRVYATKQGPAIFRLTEHTKRLLYSASQLAMDISYDVEEINEIIIDLVAMNKMAKGYVRPLFYFGYNTLGLNPLKNPVEFTVACWPWGAYLDHDAVDVMTSKYMRIHPKTTVADAKLCGNYLNSQLASLELTGTHYHEVLLLDNEGHVAEGAGENIFIVKNNALYTPKLGKILVGITRDTVIALAKSENLSIYEVELSLDDVYSADEAFFTGTAAEVTAIRSLDDQIIGNGHIGPITEMLKQKYQKLIHGELEALSAEYLTYVVI